MYIVKLLFCLLISNVNSAFLLVNHYAILEIQILSKIISQNENNDDLHPIASKSHFFSTMV